MERRYLWLLFDADGTILDYKAAEADALKAAIDAFGFALSDEVRDRYHVINSALWARLEQGTVSSAELRVRRFEELAAEFGWSVDAAALSEVYLGELSRGGHMMPGAMDMLDRLPEDRNRAIITNGIRDVQYGRLAAAGIRDRFAAVAISEEIGVAKPAPGYFDYVLDLIGFRDTSRMLVIGDSLSSDMAGGIGYGIDTCWFNPGRKANPTELRPTYEIAAWPELFPIIES